MVTPICAVTLNAGSRPKWILDLALALRATSQVRSIDILRSAHHQPRAPEWQPPERLRELEVRMTVVGGAPVFRK